MDRASLAFCAAALAASLALSAIGFHFAAMPREQLAASRTPQPPEKLPDVEVTGGFGTVSVIDLVGHYVENPPDAAPVPAHGAAPPATRRFGGC